MKTLLTSIIILIIVLFFLNFNTSVDSDPVGRFATKISENIVEKYQLKSGGLGRGATEEGTWLIIADFQYDGQPIDIEMGRVLMVEISEEFLRSINENEEIRPYLKIYPFTLENLSIGIYCYGYEGEDVLDPYLNTISLSNGKIGFFTRDPDDRYKYKSKIYEPYADALEKVKAEK